MREEAVLDLERKCWKQLYKMGQTSSDPAELIFRSSAALENFPHLRWQYSSHWPHVRP